MLFVLLLVLVLGDGVGEDSHSIFFIDKSHALFLVATRLHVSRFILVIVLGRRLGWNLFEQQHLIKKCEPATPDFKVKFSAMQVTLLTTGGLFQCLLARTHGLIKFSSPLS